MEADCRGSNSLYIKLVSSDHRVFYALREYAATSSFIKSILECPLESEDEVNEIVLESIPGRILESICAYFDHLERYKDCDEPPDFEPTPDIALDLLIAADFLGC